ncbi:MAG: hypothetical protein D6763_09195 [Alphaproteobacteria bacterium]|nr:MAG: hypothetical protein D6763_09195 [Alphaproteobacteria bacterium]
MSDKEIVETSGEKLDRKRELRRSLLKAGAVGAPLALTFKSSSAWAVSAGCLIQNGDLAIPGEIVAVDENFQPIPNGDDGYQTIFVSQSPNDIADGKIDRDRLRALVYNNNIGMTCLQSITDAQISN